MEKNQRTHVKKRKKGKKEKTSFVFHEPSFFIRPFPRHVWKRDTSMVSLSI
jgi:hypothetical protein